MSERVHLAEACPGENQVQAATGEACWLAAGVSRCLSGPGPAHILQLKKHDQKKAEGRTRPSTHILFVVFWQ